MVTEIRTGTLLEIKHMSVDYASTRGSVHAVNDVNFTIERGQIFGLAGESGSGKSTLAYAIARLLQPPAVVTRGRFCTIPRDARRAKPPKMSEQWMSLPSTRRSYELSAGVSSPLSSRAQ